MDCSLPGSSAPGISQARILEWGAISLSRGSSWPMDQTHVSSIGGGLFSTEPLGKTDIVSCCSVTQPCPTLCNHRVKHGDPCSEESCGCVPWMLLTWLPSPASHSLQPSPHTRSGDVLEAQNAPCFLVQNNLAFCSLHHFPKYALGLTFSHQKDPSMVFFC